MKYTSNYLFPKLFLAITVLSTLITSCKQQNNINEVPKITQIEPNDKSKYLKEIINPDTTPFKFSEFFSNKDDIGSYVGKTIDFRGINIFVTPNSIKLKDGSNAPDGNYKIAVRNYDSSYDMLKAGISQLSDGKLLATGGGFYWEIQDENGNNDYKVDDASFIFFKDKSDFNVYSDKIKLLEGKETGKETGIVNWINPSKFKLRDCTNRPVPIFKKKPVGVMVSPPPLRGYCKSFNSTIGTGFYNTEIFIKFETDKRTQFKVKLYAKSSHKITASKVAIKAKMHTIGAYLFPKEDYYASYDNSIPVGMKLKIIAMGENDEGKFFLKEQEVTIAGDDTFEMELEPSSTEEIETALKQ